MRYKNASALTSNCHSPSGIFFHSAFVTVRTTIVAMPSVRIQFAYEVRNEAGELINEAVTTLVFIDRETNKLCHAPEELLVALAPHFS